MTFYQSVDDLPDFEDYSMENRTYRYFTGKPLYPFGHGLSYTTYEVLKADADDLTVSAEIRNTGSMAGDALIQVYAACDSPFAPVHPRLCGFQRVSLNPGETKTVSVTLDPFTRTVINSEGNRISAEHGTLYVGLGQPGFENAGGTVEIRF